jgi:hypothetical protein
MIDHNTNVWASKRKEFNSLLRGTVGMMELSDPPETFFSKSILIALESIADG